MREIVEANYGGLFESSLIDEICQKSEIVAVPSGSIIISNGDPVSSVPLILTGAIRVLQEDINGNEILLYYIKEGDMCAMSLNCIMSNGKSEVNAITELDSELILIPKDCMNTWLDKYKGWRKFILESYHARFQELLQSYSNTAFMKMDERLLWYLKKKAKLVGSNMICKTHIEIAMELNTSRVVISRHLKKLEVLGQVKLSQAKIVLLDV